MISILFKKIYFASNIKLRIAHKIYYQEAISNYVAYQVAVRWFLMRNVSLYKQTCSVGFIFTCDLSVFI